MKFHEKTKKRHAKKLLAFKKTNTLKTFQYKMFIMSLNYHLFRDFLSPKPFPFNEADNFIYPAKLLWNQQILLQARSRKNCVILEFQCKEQRHFTNPFYFLEHKFCLNDKIIANKMSYYMLQFQLRIEQNPQNFFVKVDKEFIEDEINLWIDNMMEYHKEDVMFMSCQKILNHQMMFSDIVLNSKFLEWLFVDDDINFIDPQVLDTLGKIWVFNSFQNYFQEIYKMLSNSPKLIFFNIQTSAGIFQSQWTSQYFFFPHQQKSYFCFIHPKSLHNSELVNRINLRKQQNQGKNIKNNSDWGDLLSLYYLSERKTKNS